MCASLHALKILQMLSAQCRLSCPATVQMREEGTSSKPRLASAAQPHAPWWQLLRGPPGQPVSSPRPGRQIVVCVCVRERERERKTERESERAGSRTQEHTLSLLSSPPHTYSHTHTLAHLHMGLGPTPQLAVLSFVQLGRLSRGGQAPHGPCHKARVTSDTIRVALTLIQSD